MSLKKCRDCNTEVSKSAKECPNCGAKNPAKKKLSLKQKLFIASVAIVVMILSAPTQEDKNKQLENLKQKITTLDKLDYENRYITYGKMYDLAPKDEEIKKQYELYKSFSDHAITCAVNATKIDKQSLTFKDTYKNDIMDKYNSKKWIDENTFIYQNSFSGKNAFNIEQSFISKYKCTITKDGLRIKQIELKEI